jgi:hypothetical protein
VFKSHVSERNIMSILKLNKELIKSRFDFAFLVLKAIKLRVQKIERKEELG